MSTPNSPWKDKHQKEYAKNDWINKPSLFALDVLHYLPKHGRILELGAGQGQDSRYFAEHGYQVLSTDLEDSALKLSSQKTPNNLKKAITLQKVDLARLLPLPDASFDIVYAHLSLHYFSHDITRQLFAEIYRVLIPGGALAFMVNSMDDIEYGSGHQIEPHYFQIEGHTKRYFSTTSAGQYAAAFQAQLLDSNGKTHKDRGNHHLIRFIGIKPKDTGV